MSAELREYVTDLLGTYHKRSQQIALLRYELAHPAHVSQEEMINSMSFARGDDLERTQHHISNKTLYIALNYQEQADKANSEIINEVAGRLVELEGEQNRLLYYISLLEKRQAQVLRLFYFEECTWDEIARELGVAPRTAHKIKNQAIDKLAELYAFAGKRGQ